MEPGRPADGGILNKPVLGLPTLGLNFGPVFGAAAPAIIVVVGGVVGVVEIEAVPFVAAALLVVIIFTPALPDLRKAEGGGGLFGTVPPTLGTVPGLTTTCVLCARCGGLGAVVFGTRIGACVEVVRLIPACMTCCLSGWSDWSCCMYASTGSVGNMPL